ncbi:histidine kinase [Actinophytocola oryzae]|uniref:histidine kinase n=2 Tax=Actinophytocola oryzae TaxID=502181 RepID=A0A4V3FUH4_9PSEU|nr:histidine kinase [Actinophytocola oryzae]
MTTRLPAFVRRPLAQDAVLATALAAVVVLVDGPSPLTGGTDGAPVGGERDGQVVLWSIAAVLVLAGITVRRRWPVPTLAVCALASSVRVDPAAPATILDLVDLGLVVLLYTVAARYGHRAVSFAALAGTLLLIVGWSTYLTVEGRTGGVPQVAFDAGRAAQSSTEPPADAPVGPADPGGGSTFLAGLFVLGPSLVASWAVGAGAHSRRVYVGQLRARAHDLERERDQQAQLAAAAERDRITRELHDVVAHGLAVIVIQAQGGSAALGSRPADTRAALEKIVQTGRDSLADMRRMLGPADVAEDARHPRPGLSRLPALVAQVRMSGTPVLLNVEGTATALPPTVDLSAYRIVQEALTNTMKHATGSTGAEVLISYTDTEVSVEVRDDGSGAGGHDNGGNGLRGMRERVRLLGGRFAAGPRPDGGFAVRATLPTGGGRT